MIFKGIFNTYQMVKTEKRKKKKEKKIVELFEYLKKKSMGKNSYIISFSMHYRGYNQLLVCPVFYLKTWIYKVIEGKTRIPISTKATY